MLDRARQRQHLVRGAGIGVLGRRRRGFNLRANAAQNIHRPGGKRHRAGQKVAVLGDAEHAHQPAPRFTPRRRVEVIAVNRGDLEGGHVAKREIPATGPPPEGPLTGVTAHKNPHALPRRQCLCGRNLALRGKCKRQRSLGARSRFACARLAGSFIHRRRLASHEHGRRRINNCP